MGRIPERTDSRLYIYVIEENPVERCDHNVRVVEMLARWRDKENIGIELASCKSLVYDSYCI